MRTPGSEPYFEAGPEFAALVARSTPLGRPGRAAEVAEAAAWLLSGRASYVAGGDAAGGRRHHGRPTVRLRR
ncbi:SDR family oxidoreductase [Kitasatospora aureofaciens]|uniref:SDR family oxidoreductase n=1 Tax=Kitasatospora aureofaciens TaxID=1894 RepID=UPI0036F4606A